jgi:adenosine deaminase
MIDNHLHYTGSLPREFVFNKTIQKFPERFKLLNEFSEFIDSKFVDDHIKNKIAFNEIYALFQSVTKPDSSDNIQNIYAEGTYEIAKKAIHSGIKQYNIIAGPYPDIKRTHERYQGMIDGFRCAEQEFGCSFGKITITFIRDENGKFKNLSDELLKNIFDMVVATEFRDRFSGFDISGYEFPNKILFKENIELLNKLTIIKKQYNLDIDIGLHAGEVITNTSADALYDDYFNRLADLDIQRIGHGTYLWCNHDNKKIEILKRFSDKCIFDICPTSNRLLTTFIGNVPNDLFNSLGIKFSLNRDDPSIFNNWLSP